MRKEGSGQRVTSAKKETSTKPEKECLVFSRNRDKVVIRTTGREEGRGTAGDRWPKP